MNESVKLCNKRIINWMQIVSCLCETLVWDWSNLGKPVFKIKLVTGDPRYGQVLNRWVQFIFSQGYYHKCSAL